MASMSCNEECPQTTGFDECKKEIISMKKMKLVDITVMHKIFINFQIQIFRFFFFNQLVELKVADVRGNGINKSSPSCS